MKYFYSELIKDTNASTGLLMKAAKALPADKLDWTPGGKARNTMDILKECAGFPQWIIFAVQNKRMPTEAETNTWQTSINTEATTLATLTDVLTKETEKFCAFIEKFPEARLTEEMTFPWGTYSIGGVLGFHYWNNTYHLGQLNYLQMILGDAEMHL